MLSKLGIGTAQFGMTYGINNTSGIPGENELKKIFDLLIDNDINTFDTAHGYGNSEERLKPLLFNGANVISKFPPINNCKELDSHLQESLKRLGLNQLYAFLAHDSDSLITHPELWFELCRFQEKGLIKKKGYSLYYPEQLSTLIRAGLVPDIIQIPYNLLDRRFSQSIEKLKLLGTEIHVRSIFLQGLYLVDINNLPTQLNHIAPELKKLHNFARDQNINMLDLALNFAIENPFIDKVIVGVDNEMQLKTNIESISNWKKENNKVFDLILQLECSIPELLIPSNW